MRIREQIEWIKSEADLYDMQGLSVDMEHADKLFAVVQSMEAMLEVVEAAIPCAKGCRRCDGFDRQYKLQDALAKLEDKL